MSEEQTTQPEVAEFRPFAYFDKHLDCIRVQLRDCSVVEQRKNRIFTVLKAAHGDRTLVGFNIKGVRHMVRQVGLKYGLDLTMCYTLAQLMEFVVRAYPEKEVQEIAEHFAPMLKRESLDRLSINLNNGAIAAA